MVARRVLARLEEGTARAAARKAQVEAGSTDLVD